MNEIDNEKAILEQAPDFDNQVKILEEEHEQIVKKRKWYILIISILLLVVLIFIISYSTIYHYREYGFVSNNNCENVNLKVDGSPVPNLNITEGNNCKPIYNVDYYNNRKAMFNIDIYGDRTVIFNRINQLDSSGSYCILNCDADSDGWPDYNLDLDGNGTADINIVSNPKNGNTCNINCDLNKDTIADINLDLNNDGIADVNITDGNSLMPIYNIDYKGNRKATFNINENGTIKNQVMPIQKNAVCENNCDIDGDGWPDYNITLVEGGNRLNQLIESGNNSVSYNLRKDYDWKCIISQNLKECKNNITTKNNKYINIDIDGDGIADVNISSDGGQTIINAINKEQGNITLNIDKNEDGFPDYNIDINNDGIADLNIIENNEYNCIRNCDTNYDGKEDYLIPFNEGHTISITNLNIDIDYDGICDVNCDQNYDLYPDINVDVNGDNIADINIDYNHDNQADFNIDTNLDNKPELNLDAYGLGVCNFNCNGLNSVNYSSVCTSNCDTNNDGWPDMNVDIEGDGICDFNCNNGQNNIDADKNYYLDSEYDSNAVLDITNNGDADFYIMNPLEIKSDSIEPGWNDKYVLEIKNNAYYAVAYRIVWENVTNEFTDINNLDYSLSRSNREFITNVKAPRNSVVLKDNLIIRSKSGAKYVLDMYFRESGLNQNIDSGKTFKGQLKVQVMK